MLILEVYSESVIIEKLDVIDHNLVQWLETRRDRSQLGAVVRICILDPEFQIFQFVQSKHLQI